MKNYSFNISIKSVLDFEIIGLTNTHIQLVHSEYFGLCHRVNVV